MASRLILAMSLGSVEEARCTCLREVKASHSQRMWAEVSSSAPHLLHYGPCCHRRGSTTTFVPSHLQCSTMSLLGTRLEELGRVCG